MKCSAFIATSVDGFIARKDGSVDWLHTAGNQDIEMGNQTDMGFYDYLKTVDCLIMGRKTMEVIANMKLTEDQWPYGNMPIVVLSSSLTETPESLAGKIRFFNGQLQDLLDQLEADGYHHAYIDGGTTIQQFINEKLMNEMTIARVPVLLGEGIPLFGKPGIEVRLTDAETKAYPNDFVQVKYQLHYD